MVFDICSHCALCQYSLLLESLTTHVTPVRERGCYRDTIRIKESRRLHIERHAQYEDSTYKSYYNIDNFSSNNHVELFYEENEGLGYCDLFSVTDYGAGMW